MRYKIIKSCAPGRHIQQGAFSKNVSFKNQFSNWCGNLRRTAGCILKKRVIPNQCAHWCGNLLRHCDRILLTGRLPHQ